MFPRTPPPNWRCLLKRLAERIVCEDDVRRLMETDAKPRDKVLLRLLYAAGLRVSEACGLLWRNVRPRGDSGQITVFGKNGRTRSIALTAPLWAELTALRGMAGAEEPVFPSRSGKLLDHGRVRVIVRRAGKRAGVADAVSPDWLLRHAHASHALDHCAGHARPQFRGHHQELPTRTPWATPAARFLALERFSPEPSRIGLPLSAAAVMNVSTAKYKRPKAKPIMATFTIDSDNNITAHSALPAGTNESQSFSNPKELARR